jgi:hypothetical protein
VDSKTHIYFADLTHTATVVSANFFPLGIGFVGAYLSSQFPGQINLELFKYPKDFCEALTRKIPRIVGFSNYSWNLNLSYEYVSAIKSRSPETVVVMGGPNYGLSADEMAEFWREYPLVDFYLIFEGEKAFSELYKVLQGNDFDVGAIKNRGIKIPNCHYLHQGSVVEGDVLPRISDLEELPSPYLMGLMDKFFDGILIPMISSTRGCPFKCTFCSEGHGYYSKVSKRFDLNEELRYIAEKVGSVKDLCFTDANWGMFKEDLEKAEILAGVQKEYGWPKRLVVSSGKNQKERVMKVASLLNGAMFAGGAMQSTDPEILKNIKRSNISLDELGTSHGETTTLDMDSYTELILALPGDSVNAHTKSLKAMVEVGVNRVRMYQLIMLRQTEMNSIETREKFGLQTKFRIMPRSFGSYKAWDTEFTAVEYEEICIANNTMTFEEYLDCRELNLTIEVLNNGRLFYELRGLCKQLGLSWVDLLLSFHSRRMKFDKGLANLYKSFRNESVEGLWSSAKDLQEDVKKDIDKYLANDEGTNEMSNGKARAVFKMITVIHDLLFHELKSELKSRDLFDDKMAMYLDDLKIYSLLRKENFLDTTIESEACLNFDFPTISEKGFAVNPFDYIFPKPVSFIFKHDKEQANLISSYIAQYGSSLDGLGRILMRTRYHTLVRSANYRDKVLLNTFPANSLGTLPF